MRTAGDVSAQWWRRVLHKNRKGGAVVEGLLIEPEWRASVA
ncbi:MAG: hypothetical protein NFCOHLIN_02957 [Gammaproteobacteria bacterium]|nr:hypothetical protein [Gammaproteobacteria bacterium]